MTTAYHSTSATAAATTNREELVNDLSQMPLIGEVISWSLLENRGQKNSHVDVVNALQQNGLDASLAKEFTPAKAFTRALLKLKEQRVVDIIRSDVDEILFQFSKRETTEDSEEGGEEIEWKKEHKLLLNKTTGKISCRNDALRERAQKELDRCLEERTTGDVTNLLDRLFKVNSDLIPVGTGVFFVPEMYAAFNEKIEGFMRDLGRKIVRFPIPKGTAVGDRSVQEVVSKHIKDMLDELKAAVNSFTPTTRQTTVDATVTKINSCRTKAEAYVTLLQDYQEEILLSVDEVNTQLAAKVDELEEEKKNNPDLSSNVAQLAEKILSVANQTPKTPKTLKQEMGIEVSVTINSALVKLLEAGKLTKKDGGYIKV